MKLFGELVLAVGLLSVFHVVCGQADNEGPLVDTIYGTLRGLSDMDRLNRTYDVFYGIPFAQPPVNDLRWKPTQSPPDSWDGVRNATEFGPHCIQLLGSIYGFMGMGSNDSEDCLYLNVYVPVGVDSARNLPVMFFFYGGAYIIGTAEMYPGEELATTGNVIVVTTNYRVSIMGFLSTGDEASPGNYAMWDGKAALEWTRDNIGFFGGNPDEVTVFGHSAGAGMTMFSVLSSQTNRLFQRAIAVSGSATGITTYTDDAISLRNTQFVADLFFCNTTDTVEIMDCLFEKDAKDLDTLSLLAIVSDENRIPGFVPVLDGVFVEQDARKSFEEGVGSHIDLMTGYTVNDGAAFSLGNPLGSPPLFNITREGNRNNTEIYDFFMTLLGSHDREALYQVLLDRYPDINSTDDETCSEAATDVTTYIMFSAAAHYEAQNHAAAVGGGSTYLYRYEYRHSFLTGYPDWVNGSHMDDIYSVLGDPFMKVFRVMFLDTYEFTEDDEQISANVISRFTNFAYTGNPNEGPNPQTTIWPNYETSEFLIQSTRERITSLTSEEASEIDWFLNEFWPLLKPEWQEPEPEVTPEVVDEDRIRVDEAEFELMISKARQIFYSYVAWDEEAMSLIDERIESALLSREVYRLMSELGWK